MKKSYILPFLGIFCMIFMQKGFAQGSYPFPQDVEYTYGQMPTNKNSADAQAAYEAWKRDYVTTEGACGFRRVIFDYYPGTGRGAEDRSMTVSEGIAYGMLLAAYAGDRPVFDGLWGYYKHHRNGNGVMHWKIQNCQVVGANGASDAELDVAMALIVASYQWQSDSYLNDAKNMIRIIRTHEFDGNILKPGDMFGGWSLTNPSYFSPHYYRVFKRYDPGYEQFWDNVAAEGYKIIEAAGGSTGLVPDFCRADGEYSPDASHYEEGGRDFIFDAVRTPFRSALDYLWHGTPEAKAYCEKIIGWLRTTHQDNPRNIGSRYATRISNSGNEGDKLGHHLNNTFLGCFAIGSMAADGLNNNQSFVNEMYRVNQEVNPSYGEYFNMTIKTIALFVQTGNFYLPPPDQCDSPDLGENRSLCEGAITLDANVANRTYTWRRNNATLNNTGQTLQVTQSGDYEVIARDSEGCTRRSKVTVYDEELNADFSYTVIAGSIRLTNTSTGGVSNYHWEVAQEGDVIFESDEENTETEILTQGAYDVTLSIDNSGFGCTGSDVITRTVIIGDGEGWSANSFNDNASAQPWVANEIAYEALPRTWCSAEAFASGDAPECLDLPCGAFEVVVNGDGQYDPFGVNFRRDDEDLTVDLDEVPYVSFRITVSSDISLGVGLNDGTVTTNRTFVDITAGEPQVVTVEFPADNTTLRTGWTEDDPATPVDFTAIQAINFFPMEDDATWAGTITIDWIAVGGETVPAPAFNLATDEDGFPVYNADGERISTWEQRVSACEGQAVVSAQSCSAEEIRWYSGTTPVATGETAELVPGKYYVELINQGGVTRDSVEVQSSELEANFRYEFEDNGLGLRLINTSVDYDSWEWDYSIEPLEEGAETWDEGYNYYEEGEYEVCLTVFNSTCEEEDRICQLIEIVCDAPMENPGGFTVVGAELVDDTVTICPSTELAISVEAIENAESYAWYGMSVDALSEEIELTMEFTESHWLKFEAYNQCGEKVEDSLYINVLPAIVAEFTATEMDETNKYALEATYAGEEDAVSYLWHVNGVEIGEGLYIEHTFTEEENEVLLSVEGECGALEATETIVVEIAVECPELGTASNIEGPAEVCPNEEGVSFSIAEVEGATTYNWTLPEGAEVIEGEGTNMITVNFAEFGGSITVTPGNACETGVGTELEISLSGAPALIAEITGEESVCVGLEDVVYSVEEVDGAVSYSWTLPEGVTITEGEGTNSITVSFSDMGGVISVVPVSACGIEGNGAELEVTIGEGPANVDLVVSGQDIVCSNSAVIYSVNAVDNATGYRWSIPEDAEITSADENSNEVTITFGETGGVISVVPFNLCADGIESAPFAVEISGAANPAGPITGLVSLCAGTETTYSIEPVDGAAEYTWTFPQGTEIISGENSNEVTVVVGSEGGEISVSPISECGNGRASNIIVEPIIAAGNAGEIISEAVVACSGTQLDFAIDEVEGATGYEWTLAGSANASFEGDASLNAVTVNLESEGDVIITVRPLSECGDGEASSTTVSVNEGAGATGPISGEESICFGSENVVFEVEPVVGAESYRWDIPAGAEIVGDDSGNSIVVNFGDAQSGYITVTPFSSCGESVPSEYFVTINEVPSLSMTGESAVCSNQADVVYTVTEVEGATYTWNLPPGAEISSNDANSNAVSVSFGSEGGRVEVQVVGGCVDETAFIDVTVNDNVPTLGPINGSDRVCSGRQLQYSVDVVNGVSGYDWNIPVGVDYVVDENTVTLDFSTPGDYTISVSPVTGCGTGDPEELIVNVGQGAGAAGPISGEETVCSGTTSVSFSIDPVAGAESYNWSVPTGAEIVGDDAGNSIVVNFRNSQSGYITVTPLNSCGEGTSSEHYVSINEVPTLSMLGDRAVCANQTDVTYTVTEVEGATYTWSLPPGAEIISNDANSNVIAVSFGSEGGRVQVDVDGGCVNESVYIDVAINEDAPALGPINGSDAVCSGRQIQYSVDKVDGVSQYVWSIPAGVANVVNENTVRLNFSAPGEYTISVSPVTGCGTGEPVEFTVNVDQGVGATGNITGVPTVCPGNEYTFRIPEVENAVRYLWSLPSGATVVGDNHRRSIVVRFGEVAGGEISVTPMGDCGNGTTATITVAAAEICAPKEREINGPIVVNGFSEGIRYSVAPVEGSTYSWTVPEGAVITRANADSTEIVVSFGNESGDVSLTEVNSEGEYTTHFPVYVVPVSSIIDQLSKETSVAPNPTTGVFNVTLNDLFNGTLTINVRSSLGSLVYTHSDVKTGSESSYMVDLSDFPSGVYFVEVQSENGVVVKRVVIN